MTNFPNIPEDSTLEIYIKKDGNAFLVVFPPNSIEESAGSRAVSKKGTPNVFPSAVHDMGKVDVKEFSHKGIRSAIAKHLMDQGYYSDSHSHGMLLSPKELTFRNNQKILRDQSPTLHYMQGGELPVSHKNYTKIPYSKLSPDSQKVHQLAVSNELRNLDHSKFLKVGDTVENSNARYNEIHQDEDHSNAAMYSSDHPTKYWDHARKDINWNTRSGKKVFDKKHAPAPFIPHAGHLIGLHDEGAHHQASESTDRWMGRQPNIKKMDSRGLPIYNHGRPTGEYTFDIEKHLAGKRAYKFEERSQLARAHARLNPEAKSLLNSWYKRHAPEFHPNAGPVTNMVESVISPKDREISMNNAIQAAVALLESQSLNEVQGTHQKAFAAALRQHELGKKVKDYNAECSTAVCADGHGNKSSYKLDDPEIESVSYVHDNTGPSAKRTKNEHRVNIVRQGDGHESMRSVHGNGKDPKSALDNAYSAFKSLPVVKESLFDTESREVIEEEQGYVQEDTDIVLEGFLFEEETHVGEHVGFRYRSAHPEGRIAKIVRDIFGKIKKVFIRPDKKDRHPGEGAEVSRRAGKFHAIAEAKDDEDDFGKIIRNHPIASKHFNDRAHEDDSSSYYHKRDRHTRIIHDLQPDGDHTVEVQGYDFSGKGRDKNPKTALDRAIQQYETNRKIRTKSVKPIKLHAIAEENLNEISSDLKSRYAEKAKTSLPNLGRSVDSHLDNADEYDSRINSDSGDNDASGLAHERDREDYLAGRDEHRIAMRKRALKKINEDIAGKFHAIAEAKENLVADHLTPNQHRRMYNYHMNAANDTFEDGGSEDPEFDAIDHYKAANHHAKRYHELSGHKLYDPGNMKPTEHITSKISEAKDESKPVGRFYNMNEAKNDEGALKYVKKIDGKWALVSDHTGKPLKYFDEKPTREEADKALRAVEFFKNAK